MLQVFLDLYFGKAMLEWSVNFPTIIYIITILIGLVISSFFCGIWVIYSYVFKSPHKGQNDIHTIPSIKQYDDKKELILKLTDKLAERPYEEVCITSFDGKKLYARYYHLADGAPIDIAFHGYRGTAVRDFCAGINLCFGQKHNVLLVDERAHGRSGGCTITFGVKERRDCIFWVRYAVDRFGKDCKIILYGVSMGAATVLMSLDMGLPENVKGVVADSPFTSPSEVVKDVMSSRGLNPKLCYPILWLSAFIYGHFRLKDANSMDSVKKTNIPVLVIHGDGDSFVPVRMSREIKAANPCMVDYVEFKGADHAFSLLSDEIRYRDCIRKYYERIAIPYREEEQAVRIAS